MSEQLRQIARIEGWTVWTGAPVPPSRRVTDKVGANRTLTSPMSVVLTRMPVGSFIEIDDEGDRAQFAHRFSRMREHGQWVIRKRKDVGGWRLWRTE